MIRMGKSSRNKTIFYEELPSDELYTQVRQSFESMESSINSVIHWDSLAIIKNLPDNSVDLIITDPPYNLTKQYAWSKFSSSDNLSYEKWLEPWIVECKRVLKNDGSIYVCCDWKTSIPIFHLLSKYFSIKNRITRAREKWRWAKTNWKNNIEDIYFCVMNDNDYTFNIEDVKIQKKVIAPYRNKEWQAKDRFEDESWNKYRMTHPSNIWTDITIPFWSMPENTEHPTQKPEKLIARIMMASSNPWDIVLDPFLWSWTTSVVAKKFNRKYIWIETEKEYCVISQHRLNVADINKSIQGMDWWVFLERNDKSLVAVFSRIRSLIGTVYWLSQTWRYRKSSPYSTLIFIALPKTIIYHQWFLLKWQISHINLF